MSHCINVNGNVYSVIESLNHRSDYLPVLAGNVWCSVVFQIWMPWLQGLVVKLIIVQLAQATGDGQTSTIDADGTKASWVFREGGQDATRLMNLVNLPMLTSTAVKKMTASDGKGRASEGKSASDSLKTKIKQEFQQALGVLPPTVTDGSEEAGAANSGSKAMQKKAAFKGYDAREKANYSLTVLSFSQEPCHGVDIAFTVFFYLKI